ncbi:molybdenum cofactor synthesis domain protein [Thermodesulfobacterium geofontis OPF15]|jgi:molybdopterin molybdotransferase|uniref:Molybdopterin molybdenumtransferase n=1 Tax=Thermodesulfobacterium geofontis (strain OPF15) TaxID=795359 RepID=F8C497_THEGP|nr:gephyrin-like molybdotransferase Glp [Thermodesulfobacterium geofontis]AEH22598.1 molybdenum cofactor synthesis domain protein [Thermodesulfobacterium geofontis OPF15]
MLDKKYLTLKESVKLLLDYIEFRCLSFEIVSIESAYNRITYEDILAPENLPGFKRSTVDGFAVRSQDTFGAKETMPVYLTVKGHIPMGVAPDFSLNPGEAASIGTGGMLPEGADAVVMIEHVNVVSSDLIEILKPIGPGENVIFEDEDIKEGELVIPKGHKLKPQDIGALAGLGISQIKVVKKPVIAIILTGDEIIPYTEKVTPGKIRDINSFTLAGLIDLAGGIPLKMGIVKDDYKELKAIVNKAYELADIILITGGTSAGIKDMTAQIINELGEPGIIFHGVSIKPGKPIIAGVCNNKPVFGLPGHPVAVYICFELFVKPVINKMLGLTDKTYKPKVKAKLTKSISSQAGRRDFIRVYLEEKEGELLATPLLSKSGLIMTLVKANGILCIPEDLLGFEKDEIVEVELL